MKTSRRKKDLAITGQMARWYDKNTSSYRLAEMREYAALAASRTPKGGKVLEIAPGPGYLAIELAKQGFTVTGIELSQDFVEIEKRNAKEAGISVDFRQGNASKLPLPSETFDFAICSAAFKNFKDPLDALNEMHRVLTPGAWALILDMNHDATKEDIEEEVQKTGMKGFDRVFVKLSFKTFLKSGAYTKEGFESLISQTSFKSREILKSGIGFQVWLGK
ncbi:MAG: class I SAM-dependent methyltransferase [Clostridiales bacterium]|jgi:ubiquinone/menaquinone biosynthesis C-methylase UbiE|nr:class I SAM-dependent methyltransferase [Clostridiales bacterium]MDR2750229.1 class I SAM-dependent methyltransferase [Clostridiales bacterium]